MKTTYKVAFVVAATLASSAAFAQSNTFDSLALHSGKDIATTTAHSVNIETAQVSAPLTFIDTVVTAAASGTALDTKGHVSSSAFQTKEGHVYILGSATGGVSASFSATQGDVDTAATRLVANEVATNYVQLSTGSAEALTPGVHSYTFVVTDYSA